jgi:poly(A) polymerase
LRTYPKSQHQLSREQFSPASRTIIQQLTDHGYEAYVVGGAIRDLLLGKKPKDFDVVTSATPEQIKAVFRRRCRLIGRRFRLAHVYIDRDLIEVATFRSTSSDDADASGDRLIRNGQIIRDNVYGSIDEDAVRRDFTANALYFQPSDETILDFVNGYEDIQRRILSLIGEPAERFREDPVRMLRAIRFAVKLDLHLDEACASAIAPNASCLSNVAPARLFDELIKIFHSGYAESAFEMMREHGLFAQLFPDTAAVIEQKPEYETLYRTAFANTDERIAAGKPVTPVFLFAVLLWPRAEQLFRQHLQNGLPEFDAMNLAATQVFEEQRESIFVPRVIQAGIRHIWTLQLRFMRNRGKRVFSTLAHPRFRAAYDFLLLRQIAQPELAELARWWTEIQEVPAEKKREMIFGSAEKSKRRRRRRKKPADS